MPCAYGEPAPLSPQRLPQFKSRSDMQLMGYLTEAETGFRHCNMGFWPMSESSQNRYPSPALACQLSPAADIDRPERLGQVRITKRLYELDPWASSGDRADRRPDRQPTTTTICAALDSLRRCRTGVTCCVARLVLRDARTAKGLKAICLRRRAQSNPNLIRPTAVRGSWSSGGRFEGRQRSQGQQTFQS
jgi:hypothetical protein